MGLLGSKFHCCNNAGVSLLSRNVVRHGQFALERINIYLIYLYFFNLNTGSIVGNGMERMRNEAVFPIWRYCLGIGLIYFSNVCMFGL
jgi:hypothetical protein